MNVYLFLCFCSVTVREVQKKLFRKPRLTQQHLRESFFDDCFGTNVFVFVFFKKEENGCWKIWELKAATSPTTDGSGHIGGPSCV